MSKYLIFILACLFGTAMQAQLSVSPYFSDNMVLQRNAVNAIWGKASPNIRISVLINGITRSAQTGRDGKWRVDMPPFMAGGPYEMVVTGKGENKRFKNLLFGDVWLCSGQSNMEYQVGAFKWAQDAVSDARYPVIRFLEIPNAMDEVPPDDLPEIVRWKEATGENILSLSATAYWFAKYL